MKKNSNQPNKTALKSLFNLVLCSTSKRTVICKGLSGDQAINLVSVLAREYGAPILIKFAGMEVAR